MKRSLDMVSMGARWSLLPVLAFLGSLSSADAAEDGAITIELNKAEDTEQGCRPLFLFDNQSGHQLNKFQVDLVLFDDKGVYSRNVLLDMAPLYENKKVVASFLLSGLPCDGIGSMLVNALPSCANSTGADLDCIRWLDVSSKSSIPLEK
ncbi:MAG: Tat pathway signal sequence domain protein [Alphaproteobacteria bacterium]